MYKLCGTMLSLLFSFASLAFAVLFVHLKCTSLPVLVLRLGCFLLVALLTLLHQQRLHSIVCCTICFVFSLFILNLFHQLFISLPFFIFRYVLFYFIFSSYVRVCVCVCWVCSVNYSISFYVFYVLHVLLLYAWC